MVVRKNQSRLKAAEWRDFLEAIDGTHGMGIPAPRYRDFVRVHEDGMVTAEGMSLGVHSMPAHGMIGRNFLAWHRQYLVQLERRLQLVKPGVSIPYWDWTRDRAIPAPLTSASRLRRWGITRGRTFDASRLPTPANIRALNANTTFPGFQAELEAYHNVVHSTAGGTMNSAGSPADPLFWLHHAFVDRLWARWHDSDRGANPPNTNERMLPARAFGTRMFGNRVSKVLRTDALGYRYR